MTTPDSLIEALAGMLEEHRYSWTMGRCKCGREGLHEHTEHVAAVLAPHVREALRALLDEAAENMPSWREDDAIDALVRGLEEKP